MSDLSTESLIAKQGTECGASGPSPSVNINADRAGQLELFVAIAERHRERLLWLAYRIVQNREEAEDVVQEAMLRAMRKLADFRGDAQVSTWLRVIVQNVALEWIRARRNRTFVSLDLNWGEDEEKGTVQFRDSHLDPEQMFQRAEMHRIVLEEVAQLGSLCRNAIRMASLEERPLAELARNCNASVVGIKSRIFRGKQQLRSRICRRMGGLENIPVT